MTEPPRFSDGDPQALGASLFRSLRDDDPPADLESRTLAGLGLPLPPPVPLSPPLPSTEGGAGLGAASTAAASKTTQATVSAVFAKYFVGSVLVAGLGLGGAKAIDARLSPPPATTTSTASPRAPDRQATLPMPTPTPERTVAIQTPTPSTPPSAGAALVVATAAPRERETEPIAPALLPPPASLAPNGAAPLVATSTASTFPPAAPLVVPSTLVPPVVSRNSATTDDRATLPIQQELAALDLARSALSRGDAPGALRGVDSYRTAFPRGQLGREATVIEIEARLRSGDRATAERLGRAFLQSAPESPLAPRVSSLLGLSEEGTRTNP